MQRLIQTVYLMRLHRPIGILLLLWPTLIALWLAAGGQPAPRLVWIFTLGAIVMRSLGCVINDLADRHFDGHVERTKTRPLVTGAVSVKEAYRLCYGLAALAFALVWMTNWNTVLLSFGALAITVIYPLMKRYTHFPQVVLGAAFAWAIPMAYSAQGQPLGLDCWILYGATLLWSIAYDTMYAMVDREDDMLIGVKSTALFFNHYDRLAIFITQISIIVLFAWLGKQFEFNGLFTLSLVVASALMLYQQWLIQERDRQRCFAAFLNNQWVGAVLFLGVVAGF